MASVNSPVNGADFLWLAQWMEVWSGWQIGESVRSEDRGRDTRIGEKPRGWEDRGALFKSNGA